jgi:hypothetical protein
MPSSDFVPMRPNWNLLMNGSTERAFLKPETKRSGRSWHERTMAQWSVVQEGSLSASPSRFDREALCLDGFQGTQESRAVKEPALHQMEMPFDFL